MKKVLAVILVAVMLSAAFLAAPAYALSFTYEIGEEIWVIIAGSKGADDPISKLYDVQGLPSGLTLNVVNGWQIVLQGRAKQSGTYPFYYSFETRNNSESHIGVSDTVVINAPPVEIVKYPSSETVTEHASALFIAQATNYSTAEWRIADRDDNEHIGTEAMMNLFPGLIADAFKGDDGKEYLSLKNIPLEMNGYRVIAEFHNQDNSKSYFTSYQDCAVFVQEKELAAPVILTQPVGAELDQGTVIRLEISADCVEGTLRYQWYRNLIPSSENGIAISGENTDKFIPPQTEGNTYYYCAVWASSDEKSSTTIYSDIVSVNYFSEQTTVTTEAVTIHETGNSDISPVSDTDDIREDNPVFARLKSMDRTELIGIVGIAVLLLASGCVLILLNRRENR